MLRIASRTWKSALQNRNECRRTLVSTKSLAAEASNNSSNQTPLNPEELPEPPGMFATIGAMGAGAGGAVLIAGVGVWAVFKMAFWVAGETGRSLNPRNDTNVQSDSNKQPKIGSPKEQVLLDASWLFRTER